MNLLAVGSVVILKGGNKKIMIYGRKVHHMDHDRKYDYLGCPYPEGYIGDHMNVFFNSEYIEHVVHKGYDCLEEREMKINLTGY